MLLNILITLSQISENFSSCIEGYFFKNAVYIYIYSQCTLKHRVKLPCNSLSLFALNNIKIAATRQAGSNPMLYVMNGSCLRTTSQSNTDVSDNFRLVASNQNPASFSEGEKGDEWIWKESKFFFKNSHCCFGSCIATVPNLTAAPSVSYKLSA